MGIDISPIAIEGRCATAVAQGVDEHATFEVMNAEALEVADASFDVVCGSGSSATSTWAELPEVARCSATMGWPCSSSRSGTTQ